MKCAICAQKVENPHFERCPSRRHDKEREEIFLSAVLAGAAAATPRMGKL
jgi:hypothetical protein